MCRLVDGHQCLDEYTVQVRYYVKPEVTFVLKMKAMGFCGDHGVISQ